MCGDEEITFRCPSCQESMEVNAAMKRALLDNGCVICGSDVSPDAFVPA